jgi:hypothetical protein
MTRGHYSTGSSFYNLHGEKWPQGHEFYGKGSCNPMLNINQGIIFLLRKMTPGQYSFGVTSLRYTNPVGVGVGLSHTVLLGTDVRLKISKLSHSYIHYLKKTIPIRIFPLKILTQSCFITIMLSCLVVYI